MNIKTCIKCGHKFAFCGCPGKAMICNVCDPALQAGPRVEKRDFDISGIKTGALAGQPTMTQWVEIGSNCGVTKEQINFWKVKLTDLKASGAMYQLKLTLADVNRMLGNLDSAINTRNYCFPGVKEAEAAVVLAMSRAF